MYKFIILFFVLFLNSCSGLNPFTKVANSIGDNSEKVGKGIAAAKIGAGIKAAGKALEKNAEANIEKQKTEQKQLRIEADTSSSILQIIKQSKNPTQTLKLVEKASEIKIASIKYKAKIKIAEAEYKERSAYAIGGLGGMILMAILQMLLLIVRTFQTKKITVE